MAKKAGTPAPKATLSQPVKAPASTRSKGVERNLSILMASSEMVPFAKTGGLGDVLGALPRELVRMGHQVATVLPLYRSIKEKFQSKLEKLKSGSVPMGDEIVPFDVWRSNEVPGVMTYFIGYDPYYDRAGIYGDSSAGDYPDNAKRWIFFSKAAAETIDLLGLQIDIAHCADWHAALVPFCLRRHPEIKTVFTIHNIAFQGIYDASEFKYTNLPSDRFTPQWLEYYGKLNLMKGGIIASDMTTTVSEKYAAEIRTPEYGCGLENVCKAKGDRLVGILNGIDVNEWNPARDPLIPKNYDARTVTEGKLACKKALLSEMKLEVDASRPLLGSVMRLTGQKGVDLILQVIPQILRTQDVSYVVLGLGEPMLEQALTEFGARFQGRIKVILRMDNKVAHQIEAASDYFLMPSRFEPCGLNQMYSLRYGTVPVVRATGGLDDTIAQYDPATKKGNGFKFGPHTPAAFRACIEDALGYYDQPVHLAQLRQNGMACDFSWAKSAAKYVDLFRKLAVS
jgi:starch synthase